MDSVGDGIRAAFDGRVETSAEAVALGPYLSEQAREVTFGIVRGVAGGKSLVGRPSANGGPPFVSDSRPWPDRRLG